MSHFIIQNHHRQLHIANINLKTENGNERRVESKEKRNENQNLRWVVNKLYYLDVNNSILIF